MRLLTSTPLLLVPALLGFALSPSSSDLEADRKAALEGISAEDVEAHVRILASPQFEGRDSPSEGLERAAIYIERQFESLGIEPVGNTDYRHAFTRRLAVPVKDKCKLSLSKEGDRATELQLDSDFVPFPRTTGSASGRAVFCGFGIVSKKPRWDDLKGKKLDGAVAVLFEGEPRHRKLFEGETITEASDTYRKLKNLEEAGCVGAVIIRRPEGHDEEGEKQRARLGYRYTWASWLNTNERRRATPSARMPVVEVSLDAAETILGTDPVKLAQRGDTSGRPIKHEIKGLEISLAVETDPKTVYVDNVVGLLEGSDPELSKEYVIVGAHYDHIGVDARGRIGLGADDNASGTSALLEMTQAFHEAKPRRSILFMAFSAEEDGLVGSRALAENPPVERDSIVAMVNLDMIGRGETKKVVVLGCDQNPSFEGLLDRAKSLGKTGITKIVTNKAAHLWERSDHHSFHRIGVPVLFFFEAEHEKENPDYHTYRDTVELLNFPKIENTAKLAFNTAWLLANDDNRPPKPRR